MYCAVHTRIHEYCIINTRLHLGIAQQSSMASARPAGGTHPVLVTCTHCSMGLQGMTCGVCGMCMGCAVAQVVRHPHTAITCTIVKHQHHHNPTTHHPTNSTSTSRSVPHQLYMSTVSEGQHSQRADGATKSTIHGIAAALAGTLQPFPTARCATTCQHATGIRGDDVVLPCAVLVVLNIVAHRAPQSYTHPPTPIPQHTANGCQPHTASPTATTATPQTTTAACCCCYYRDHHHHRPSPPTHPTQCRTHKRPCRPHYQLRPTQRTIPSN